MFILRFKLVGKNQYHCRAGYIYVTSTLDAVFVHFKIIKSYKMHEKGPVRFLRPVMDPRGCKCLCLMVYMNIQTVLKYINVYVWLQSKGQTGNQLHRVEGFFF